MNEPKKILVVVHTVMNMTREFVSCLGLALEEKNVNLNSYAYFIFILLHASNQTTSARFSYFPLS